MSNKTSVTVDTPAEAAADLAAAANLATDQHAQDRPTSPGAEDQPMDMVDEEDDKPKGAEVSQGTSVPDGNDVSMDDKANDENTEFQCDDPAVAESSQGTSVPDSNDVKMDDKANDEDTELQYDDPAVAESSQGTSVPDGNDVKMDDKANDKYVGPDCDLVGVAETLRLAYIDYGGLSKLRILNKFDNLARHVRSLLSDPAACEFLDGVDDLVVFVKSLFPNIPVLDYLEESEEFDVYREWLSEPGQSHDHDILSSHTVPNILERLLDVVDMEKYRDFSVLDFLKGNDNGAIPRSMGKDCSQDQACLGSCGYDRKYKYRWSNFEAAALEKHPERQAELAAVCAENLARQADVSLVQGWLHWVKACSYRSEAGRHLPHTDIYWHQVGLCQQHAEQAYIFWQQAHAYFQQAYMCWRLASTCQADTYRRLVRLCEQQRNPAEANTDTGTAQQQVPADAVAADGAAAAGAGRCCRGPQRGTCCRGFPWPAGRARRQALRARRRQVLRARRCHGRA